ncbi:MAG TPA: hypothetical protein VI356_03465, partial [Myxococcales bacterium]
MNIDREDLLSALQKARGKGLSLKQLAGQLHVGQAGRNPLRRAVSELLREGRVRFDGRIYRLAPRAEEPATPATGGARQRAALADPPPPAERHKEPRQAANAQHRRAPAVLL